MCQTYSDYIKYFNTRKIASKYSTWMKEYSDSRTLGYQSIRIMEVQIWETLLYSSISPKRTITLYQYNRSTSSIHHLFASVFSLFSFHSPLSSFFVLFYFHRFLCIIDDSKYKIP